MEPLTSLTQIINQWQSGDKQAENQLYQFAYLQLRKIAQQERARSAKKYGDENKVLADSVNSTTALIHEAYLKMSGSDLNDLSSQKEFYLMASKVMRQILIDNARAHQAQKRQQRLVAESSNDIKFEQLISLDQALDLPEDLLSEIQDAFLDGEGELPPVAAITELFTGRVPEGVLYCVRAALQSEFEV